MLYNLGVVLVYGMSGLQIPCLARNNTVAPVRLQGVVSRGFLCPENMYLVHFSSFVDIYVPSF